MERLPIIAGGWSVSPSMPSPCAAGQLWKLREKQDTLQPENSAGLQLAANWGSLGRWFGLFFLCFFFGEMESYGWNFKYVGFIMKDMKKHTVEGRNHEFPFTEGFATFPLPANSPNNQICPHLPHEQLIEDQFGTLQGGRLSSRCWVRLRANRKTWTASFYCGQLWMVLRGDNSWKFIW